MSGFFQGSKEVLAGDCSLISQLFLSIEVYSSDLWTSELRLRLYLFSFFFWFGSSGGFN